MRSKKTQTTIDTSTVWYYCCYYYYHTTTRRTKANITVIDVLVIAVVAAEHPCLLQQHCHRRCQTFLQIKLVTSTYISPVYLVSLQQQTTSYHITLLYFTLLHFTWHRTSFHFVLSEEEIEVL